MNGLTVLGRFPLHRPGVRDEGEWVMQHSDDVPRSASRSGDEEMATPTVLLTDLWEKATGGGDVAARPGVSSAILWPLAPRPAGVEEAVKWFQAQIGAGSSLPTLLFLVGGPGAGKSHTTSAIVENLAEKGRREDGLAHRSYEYEVEGRELILINDATIRSPEYPRAPLIHDITAAVTAGSHMIACVNRGVLVEEVAQLINETETIPGLLVLEWLHENKSGPHGESGWILESRQSNENSYICSATMKEFDTPKANLAVVYMDMCSLLEERPTTTMSRQSVPSPGVYKVSEFSARKEIAPDSTPAGKLLTTIIKDLGPVHRQTLLPPEMDPISANLFSLAIPEVQSGFLSIMRAAEIASSQRFTYREVWGTIARAILGNLTDEHHPENLSSDLNAQLPPKDAGALKTFQAMQTLADRRFSQALFGSIRTSRSAISKDPVTLLTSFVDPLRDALPGESPTRPIDGWSTPISSALSGPLALRTPIENLEAELDKTDPFRLVLTPFDRHLDGVYKKTLLSHDVSDIARTKIVSWYGRYLTRLYALANGIPAFVREIEAWTQSWNLSPILPTIKHINLQDSVEALLRPGRVPADRHSNTLITVFESRTSHLTGSESWPRLAIAAERTDFRTSKRGDEISLLMQDSRGDIGSIELDFILIREALACAVRQAGITELSSTAVPRLERLRAAQLISSEGLTPQYRIVDNDSELRFGLKMETP